MFLNQCEDGLKGQRCYTQHVDKAMVVARIFGKIPGKSHIPKLWDSWPSIGVARKEDGKEGMDIKVIFSLLLLKCLPIWGCENLTHKH